MVKTNTIGLIEKTYDKDYLNPIIINTGQELNSKSEIIPMAHNFKLFIFGKSGCGKSSTLNHIIDQILPGIGNNFDEVVIVNPTAKMDPLYDGKQIFENGLDFIDFIKQYKEYEKMLFEIKAELNKKELPPGRLKKVIEKIVKNIHPDNYSDLNIEKPKRYLCIFDDVAGEPYLKNKNSDLMRFMKIARHYDTSLIFSSQNYIDLDPDFRSNMTDFIIFKGILPRDLKRIYDDFTSELFPSYKAFEKFYSDEMKKEPHVNMLLSNHNINNDKEIVINFKKHFHLPAGDNTTASGEI